MMVMTPTTLLRFHLPAMALLSRCVAPGLRVTVTGAVVGAVTPVLVKVRLRTIGWVPVFASAASVCQAPLVLKAPRTYWVAEVVLPGVTKDGSPEPMRTFSPYGKRLLPLLFSIDTR